MYNPLKEQVNALKLENKYMVKDSKNLYTVLEELDFHWDWEDVREFEQMWRKGFSIAYMEEWFGRPKLEIALLVMDRELNGRLKPREGGLYGN
jgi:hypothetical protein